MATARSSWREHWPLWLVLCLAAALRMPFLSNDLPFIYDSDEPIFVNAAISMLRNHDPNPHWFGAPAGTTINALAILYGAAYAVGRVTGRFQSAEDFRELFHSNPTLLYVIGRSWSCLFSLGAVVLTYFIARRLASRRAAWIAALLMAISPPEINLSLLVRMDALMAFFLLAGFWFCLNILDSPALARPWKPYAMIGLCLGLAVASKYPAVVFSLVIVIAHAMAWQHRKIPLLLLAGGAALAGAFLTSPYLFLDFKSVMRDVLIEARPDHLGASGSGFLGNFWRYLVESLPRAISWAGVAAMALLLAFRGRFTSWSRPGILLASFALIFTAFISALNLWWDRWFLPVIPVAAIFVAMAIDRVSPTIPRVAICALVVLMLSYSAWILFGELSGPHTRTLARQWVVEHVPAGSRVLVESATPYLPYARYQLFEVPAINPSGTPGSGEIGSLQIVPPDRGYRAEHEPDGSIGQLANLDDLRRHHVQYVILGNFYLRYLAERQRYPRIVETYEAIIGRSKLLWQVAPVSGSSRGGRIQVYQLD